nr:unnamed protein product [Spirometra erinaceieuropaei]
MPMRKKATWIRPTLPPTMAALAPAGIGSRPEARTTERPDGRDYLRRGQQLERPPPHLQYKAPTTTPQETIGYATARKVTFTAPATTTSLTTNDYTPDAPLSPISSKIPATNPPMTATTAKSPINATGDNTPTASSTATSTNSDADSVPTCPYCDHAFTPRIGLVSHVSMRNSEIHHNIDILSIPCPPNNSPIPSPVDSPLNSTTTTSIIAVPTDSASPTLPYRRMCNHAPAWWVTFESIAQGLTD